ncbi:Tetratricopeptide repeat protein 21B [Nymphon striatum]|nr:Tetratricopeptide repeat protein 21B [Nymphon striatum]
MYHGMQKAASEALKFFSGDPVYRFFHGVSFIFQGKLQEGIREIEPMKDIKNVQLGTLLALIYAHRKCRVIDKEAVNELDSKLKSSRKHTSEEALYYAGWFLFQSGRFDKSKEYVDRMIKVAPYFEKGMVLKGWVELYIGKDAKTKQTIQYFNIGQKSNIDAMFGKAKYFELKNNFNSALEILNEAIVAFPNFVPVLIEKMKVQLALRDWDRTTETAHRILSIDSSAIEALRFLSLNTLCKVGDMEQASTSISEVIKAIDRQEPQNAPLYFDTAQLFSRLCCRDSCILQHTLVLAERAANLDSSNADYVTEVGTQYVLQGRLRDAIKQFHAATKLNQTSVQALIGIIMCQIMQDQTESAEQQLEFLKELQQTVGVSAEVLYLNSMLSHKKGKSTETIINLLNQSVDTHFVRLKGLHLGIQYYLLMNPDFMLMIVKDYFRYSPSQPVAGGQSVSPILRRIQAVLEALCRACPGLLEALFLMAKVKFLCGDNDAASSTLQRCLEQNKAFTDAHMLMAEIHLLQENYQQASQSLEVGLSYNFSVRDKPSYSLIKAKIQKKMNEVEESVLTLTVAMSNAGIKPGSGSRKKTNIEITTKEKADMYLELAESHRLLNQQHEAAKIMQDALNEFQGTPEEVRVIIANSELAIARGDIELALSMLRNISPEETFYIQAREKMAYIYLNHRKDRRLFASCYREIVEKFPVPQSFLLLGDAYMSIQEPERAIDVYEQALKKNPKDSNLAKKIGNALVKTHNYGKAINYYEAAVKTGNQNFLRYDLAQLLLKLKQYEKAQKILNIALELENQGNELSTMMNRTKYLVLLSQVYQNAGHVDSVMKNLSLAKDIQTRICTQMAQNYIQSQEYETAITCYKEALSHGDLDQNTVLALCKLFLTINNLEDCRLLCMKLLNKDKENDSANVIEINEMKILSNFIVCTILSSKERNLATKLIMADLLLRKNDYQSALLHFQNLLDKQPDNYEALAKMIEAMRRIGKMEEIPNYFTKITNFSSRSYLEAGFNYCKGLYEWYTQDPSSAIKYFNKARRDIIWGEKAAYNMIEICINPDNNTLGGETFESVDSELSQKNADMDSQEVAIRTAEKLFKELKNSPDGISHLLLSNFIVLAKRQKQQVERALQDFMQIAADERLQRNNIGAILGIATAHMILKQIPKARNQLKRVAKSPWKLEDAEYLERCWLLLADIYIQSGKYDIASELLKKVLQFNKSCSKAYEYVGFIMEKEQSYKDAAENYEIAWSSSKKSNPVIGYKLAFNYMKAKRYVDAIDVCHDVLGKFPKYPKIQKEVLDKSRNNLRA